MSRGKWFGVITLAMIALVLGSPQAQAGPIIGGIAFGGDADPNTGDWDTATAVVFGLPGSSIVTSRIGSYELVIPIFTTATFYDFTFDPALMPSPLVPLWETTGGDAWFDLASVWVMNQGDNSLNLRGTGTLYLTGFDPTFGKWDFSGQSTDVSFSFSATNAAVPEPVSLVLVGLGLIAAAGVVRIRRS